MNSNQNLSLSSNLEWLLDLRLGDSGSGIRPDQRDAGSWAIKILGISDCNIS